MKLTDCPRRAIPAWAFELIEYASLFRKGLAPETGGVLDQAAAFVAAARFVWAERDRLTAEAQRTQRD